MRGKRAGAVAAMLVGVLAAGGAAAASGPPGASRTTTRDLASPARTNVAPTGVASPVSRSMQRARGQLRDSLGRGAVLTADDRTGGVKAVGRLDGFLTGASSASASDVALGWVRAHSAALGVKAADLAKLKLVRDYASTDGVRHLQWAVVVDGITVADQTLIANVASDGRLINVLGGVRGGLKLNSTSPAVPASSAYARTLRSVGSRSSVPARRSARAGATRRTTYAGNGQAELVAVTAGDGLRLAWRVLAPVGRVGDYDSLVDATTGRLVRRANLVKFANSALAADNHPGAAVGGTQQTKDITKWLFPGADTLNGNNAHSFIDADDIVKADLTENSFEDHSDVPPEGEVHPSGGDDWLYPIQEVPDPAADCPFAPGCTWDHATPFSWQVNANEAATQLFYFVNKFHDHLLAAPIGFDEASGNFQQNNPSGKGKGGDALLAQADDGANTDGAGLPDEDHIDNANMDTRPEGFPVPPRMQMYLFEPENGFASVNGADDPSVVYHEYTHGLSNRLIVDSQGFGAVGGVQSGAMGEAWSDWYALDFLAQEGLIKDTAAVGDVQEGAYVDNGQNLIRTEPIDCPPDQGSAACPGVVSGPGGYTYQDFGQIALGALTGTHISEVHGDGEIWVQTLWQMRQAFVKRYGQLNGSKRAEAIVTGGMRLGPPSPSFLDQRNAILQADTVLHGGADRDLIWQAFASRGMGYFASTKGDQDSVPDADFSLPPAANAPTGTMHGVVTDDDSQPVRGALVGLGGHDGPPGAGPALQAATGADGSYTIAGIPQGHYPDVTVDAPDGFADTLAGPVTIDGAPATRDITVRRNYADSHTGGRITSDARDDSAWGCGWGNLIDGNEANVLETAPPVQDDPDTPADETKFRTFTITLSQPVNGAEVWIDPAAACGTVEFSGLGGFDVLVSRNGRNFTPAATGQFDSKNDGHMNRVPLKNVPDGVTAVRLVARTSQGQDLAALLGDQGVMDIAELQVYGRPGGTPPGGGNGGGGPKTAKLKPKLSMNKHRRTVNRRTRRTTVKLRCVKATSGVAPSRCRGLLFISGGKKGRKALTRRTFSVPSLKTGTVRLKLTRKSVRILKRHPVDTKLHARVVNTGAGTRRAAYPVKMVLAKKK